MATVRSGRVAGSGTVELDPPPGVSVGADSLKLASAELPEVITVVPVPGAGRSTSRKDSSPFGLVVGISLPLESRIANVKVSGPTKSGFEVAVQLKLSVSPGVNVNWTSLKNELSVRLTLSGEGFTTTPPVVNAGGVPMEPEPALKLERVTVLFASPVPSPSMNWKSSVKGPFPTSGDVSIVITSAQAKLDKESKAIKYFMANLRLPPM